MRAGDRPVAKGPPLALEPGVPENGEAARGRAHSGNRVLEPHEIDALRSDNFLLGPSEKERDSPPADTARCAEANGSFAELDVCLARQDLATAEQIWKRAAANGLDRVAERPDLRAIGFRYVTAMRAHALNELESALDRQDTKAAQREHDRLSDLRDRRVGGRFADATCGDPAGRSVELEARYQQVCHGSGPLMCTMLPKCVGVDCAVQ